MYIDYKIWRNKGEFQGRYIPVHGVFNRKSQARMKLNLSLRCSICAYPFANSTSHLLPLLSIPPSEVSLQANILRPGSAFCCYKVKFRAHLWHCIHTRSSFLSRWCNDKEQHLKGKEPVSKACHHGLHLIPLASTSGPYKTDIHGEIYLPVSLSSKLVTSADIWVVNISICGVGNERHLTGSTNSNWRCHYSVGARDGGWLTFMSGGNLGDSTMIDGLSVATGHFQFSTCNQRLPRRREVIPLCTQPHPQSAASLPTSENIQVTLETVAYKSFPVQTPPSGGDKRKMIDSWTMAFQVLQAA